ncbi:phosphotransferase [Isoptericola cucumis]|uniref:Aminoglycoside phosphotransferase domain-containing protein n=1 Tax=Isoptericola cucumis TaxID=1776856 RepID=A0ABQ2B2U7_9MICO|nr:phosphotransferase [Isoptericola cucumis]GGI06641.1 hypothetical protein GCM10007368_12180 [Isoptericola cucumis]
MELLAAGRDADVFALDDDRVLRRYRDGRPAAPDADLLSAVVASGFPAPAVLGVEGADLVLERLDGPSLGSAVFDGGHDAAAGGVLLADLHSRLHALPWEGGTLLHLDLHPFNVVLARRGPVVIDWTDARPGPAGLDVAMTALVCAQAALSPDATPLRDLPAGAAFRATSTMLASFVAAAGSDYLDHLDEALALRRANPMMTGDELARLDEAVALASRPA